MTLSGVEILSLEAKDIYLHNEYYDKLNGLNIRYQSGDKKGEINIGKFINTLDYSLELIKLREVYEKKYRNSYFSFEQSSHQYTKRIINVTYKYALKEYNKISKNTYVKLGHQVSESDFNDCVCFKNDELIAIKTNQDVETPKSDKELGKSFSFKDGKYHSKANIKTIVSTKELREYTYKNGFICDGIEFVRFKRSSGASRVGKCLFIDKKLHNMMMKWSMCGIKFKKNEKIDLAALEAYLSLTLSSIIGVLDIKPENILLIDDYESVFEEKVIETRSNGKDELETSEAIVEIRNSIWDGMSLMDISLFDKYSHYGMLLLRNRFFKSCCFNSNIQKWFKDNNITEVSQLNGKTRAKDIKDIKLITTPSSIKYLKFGSFDSWLDNIDETFGIVKHEKPTHFFEGNIVQTHYQLLNTLQLSESDVKDLLKESFQFLDLLKVDPGVVRYFIKYPIESDLEITPATSKNDVVFKLLGVNDKITKTKMYNDFLKDLIKSLIKLMRCGKIFVKGNYETLVSCPIEMLQSSIYTFDGHSVMENNTIHTEMFENNEELVCSRSPHVCPSNILYTKNLKNDLINKYINLTNEIVCVNTINDNIMNKLAGCDFDSDSVMITNNKIIVNGAKKNYCKFLTSTDKVAAIKIKRLYEWLDKLDLDFKTGNNLIGEIINLAQELITLLWDMLNNGATFEEVQPIIFDLNQLSVLSGIEIDKAKKEYKIDSSKELKKIREKYRRLDDSGKIIKPYFFKYISQYKGFYDPKKNSYIKHKTTMDYLETAINKYQRNGISLNKNEFIPFSAVIKDDDYVSKSVYRKQTERIINLINEYKSNCFIIYTANANIDNKIKFKMLCSERQRIIEYIGNLKFTRYTMIHILKTLSKNKYEKEFNVIFEFLFGYPNTSFYEIIKESFDSIYSLDICQEKSDYRIFGINFIKKHTKTR